MTYRKLLRKMLTCHASLMVLIWKTKVVNIVLDLLNLWKSLKWHFCLWPHKPNYIHTQVCILAKGKTTLYWQWICLWSDSQFWNVMKTMWFLTSNENKIINGLYTWELLMPYSYLLLCLLLRALRNSKPDSQEGKGNHIADNSAENAAFKRSKVKPLSLPKGIHLYMIIWKQ